MVFACNDILSACVGGLIASISALAWSLKQQVEINKLKEYLEYDKTL